MKTLGSMAAAIKKLGVTFVPELAGSLARQSASGISQKRGEHQSSRPNGCLRCVSHECNWQTVVSLSCQRRRFIATCLARWVSTTELRIECGQASRVTG